MPRVLIVDDSAVMRRAITRILEADPAVEVVGTARDGADGLAKAKTLAPDVITLDIEMPVMDGLTALRRIRAECDEPKPVVLMCSSLTTEGSEAALRALRLGAADVITKDPQQLSADPNSPASRRLRMKIHALAQSRHRRLAPARPPTPGARPDRLLRGAFDAIVIGSSTGGPPVLETVLRGAPADLPCPIVVAQHMPELFTKSLAARLDQHCAITVVHADRAVPLAPGTAYIVRGGTHGRIVRAFGNRVLLKLTDEPREALFRPSVDTLIASAAECYGKRCLAIVLTGMGEDGTLGARRLADRGGTVINQDEPSCVVYGMPRAVADSGCSTGAYTPDEIAALLGGLGAGELRRTA